MPAVRTLVSDLLASKLFGKIDPASAADGSSRTDRVDNVLRDPATTESMLDRSLLYTDIAVMIVSRRNPLPKAVREPGLFDIRKVLSFVVLLPLRNDEFFVPSFLTTALTGRPAPRAP